MAIKTYRVELEPLEPYFFAGERSFGFGKNRKQNYNNYFIRSESFPTQTTLLGTIRFEILKKYDLLTTDINKQDSNLLAKQAKYIGAKSFDLKETTPDYGMIKKLSPLFIVNQSGERLVRVPFNQNPESKIEKKNETIYKYDLRTLKKDPYQVFDGTKDYQIKLINKVELKSEGNVQRLFYNIDNRNDELIDEDIFIKGFDKFGINRYIKKDGFFKKEYKYLVDGYKFGFYLEIDDENYDEKLEDIIQDVVYMGSGKSAFALKMTKEEETIDNFIDRVVDCFSLSTDDPIYYVISDTLVDYQKIEKSCYLVISDTRTFRYLSRNHQAKNYYKLYCQSDLYNIIRAGSVFFVKGDQEDIFINEVENNNYEKIGFNKVLKIGGKK
ncbi:type III-B CRISPR module-associated Cmr3 family protein [Thomasclavelia sp.]|uniref:type III-B CRISPR module-associated Cmr3 family protein n=1 Tax=Thomasclavelia sp. TaxID=3025757 RepID=UPI0025DE2A07|nr:type III-B CRISPR module-associated Cmr3 family protein [Thomasclavelia sp.]